jgi:hypothetical protein
MLVALLTGQQEKLLKALQSLGSSWYTRAEIAKALSKNRLNPVDITVLDFLVDHGYAEKQMQVASRPQINAWTYRVKGG